MIPTTARRTNFGSGSAFSALLVALLAACTENKPTPGAPAASSAGSGGLTSLGGNVSSGGNVSNGGNVSSGSAGNAVGGSGGLPEPADSRPFFRESTVRVAPPFVPGGSAPPSSPGDAVSIEVDPTSLRSTIPSTLFGNNAGVWNGMTLLSAEMEQRLKAVNVSLLRFPGGSTSDTYHWDGAYPPYAVAQKFDAFDAEWAVDTAEYMAVVRKLGAIPLLTVNHGYATYDTTSTDGKASNAARLAADWVEYCNSPNDGSNANGGTDWAAKRASAGYPEPFRVRYWEIGNEVYGSWEVGYDPQGSAYASDFNVIADAMKAVDPSIYIGLVVTVDQANSPWTTAVLSNPGTADRADFMVVHEYFHYLTKQSDISALGDLARAARVGVSKAWLDELVAKNTTKVKDSVPYYLGEYNINHPSNPLQLALVSALFVSKVLGELARTGWAAASMWDVINGYDVNPVLGAGDHGFLATQQEGVTDLTPRPSYYPFYFYTRNFGDTLVQTTSSDPAVVAYGSTWTSGQTGLVLVNEGATSKHATLSFANGSGPTQPANVWSLTGASLEAQVVSLNGVGNGLAAGGVLPDDVKPYVLVPSQKTLIVDLPANSVTSLVSY